MKTEKWEFGCVTWYDSRESKQYGYALVYWPRRQIFFKTLSGIDTGNKAVEVGSFIEVVPFDRKPEARKWRFASQQTILDNAKIIAAAKGHSFKKYRGWLY